MSTMSEARYIELFGVAKAHLWTFADCLRFAQVVFGVELREISLTQCEVMEVVICSGWRLK